MYNKILLCFFISVFFSINFADNITKYILLSSKVANKHKQHIAVNNFSNKNSIGFQKDTPILISKKMKRSNILMPIVYQTQMSQFKGEVQKTNRDLDIALKGEGYFKLKSGNMLLYTLDGRMHINKQGILVNQNGDMFLDDGNNIIVLDEDFSHIQINKIGEISIVCNGKNEKIAQIGVFSLKNFNLVKKVGSNTFVSSENTALSDDYVVEQGYVNLSNVDSIEIMNEISTVNNDAVFLDKVLSSYFQIESSETNQMFNISK